MNGLGDYLGGAFRRGEGDLLESRNPATGDVVVRTTHHVDRIVEACDGAAEALPAWRRLSFDGRLEHLHRFREAIRERTEPIAEAISLEMGKLRAEARTEVAALLGRFDLMEARIRSDLRDGPLPGFPLESLVHRPLGVVGVIGPFNFPLHLCHAHVVPALMLGNTVVMKPSEVTPLAGQRYAEAAHAAGLPPGVLSVVQGTGAAGAALVGHPELRGLCFTGSWGTGRRILEATLDRPEVLVALEMGGKNTSIVLDDADVRQAAHEIVVGGYLTTGQRCTCTDRVLVQRKLRKPLLTALRNLVGALRLGIQDDGEAFAGPMASDAAKARYEAALGRADAAGAERLAEGWAPPGHAFVKPTLFALPEGVHRIPGYTDTELFGPNLHVETVEDEEEAIAVLRGGPVALANAVFTADPARHDRLREATDTAIINWNRSTNQASPRLPFGGTGTAGNYRPAGAHAPRNLAVPIALQRKVPGALAAHPQLANHLPLPDLDTLAQRHGIEECKEATRHPLTLPRPQGLSLPRAGSLPQSTAYLERLYGEDRVPREKKPGVFDHVRSSGPWMVSVDEEPLAVLDGMSQTATHPAGFSADVLERAYDDGAFADALLDPGDGTLEHDPARAAFAETLRRLVPGLPEVSFVNSGAEANEKAYALCLGARSSDKQQRLLAFEGSFHGRTLLSLFASHNPSKRVPFEIPGYEVTYAPFPQWLRPDEPEPGEPEGFREQMATAAFDGLDSWPGADDLWPRELESLRAVHASLSSGEFFAVVIEPMQSEGGDRYATARFHRALRLLTRHHAVPLIYDEVQTGFGLGGTFTWHSRFGLVTRDGEPDRPDCLLFAKRAQVGVVMGRFPDPEPTSVHPVSLVRGRLHAQWMASDGRSTAVESRMREGLMDLRRRFPELVSAPRATGYAAAFDLPSAAHLGRYLSQRFWRGAVVFGAGSRTVRYRLSTAFSDGDLELLLETMRRTLAWIEGSPGIDPPTWLDLPPSSVPARLSSSEGTSPSVPAWRLRAVEPEEGLQHIDAMMEIEARTYEPARREPRERLERMFRDPDAITVLAEAEVGGTWALVGFALAAPLEAMDDVEGLKQDRNYGCRNTAYSLAVTVDPDHRGRGLGRALKGEQLRLAAARKDAAGTARFDFVSGRNRVGATAAMERINRSYGAYTVQHLRGQYGDPEGEALYYRIPLRPRSPSSSGGGAAPAEPSPMVGGAPFDLSLGTAQPFRTSPESLLRSAEAGLLRGPTINKITVLNYVTPAIVRAVEWVAAVTPEHPHLYLTSSRDEAFDKAIRTLRFHRKGASVALGVEGGYAGHTSAAARSLSDPNVHAQGPAYFRDWERLPHPCHGEEVFESALRAAVARRGGADKILGLFVEPLQERTGRALSKGTAAMLDRLRTELGVPLVFMETASAYYRGGGGAFLGQDLGVVPDIRLWWAGGQLGLVHMSAATFVKAPLTMVSTWDGDELSLIRAHHQLRAARNIDVAEKARWLDQALAPCREAGVDVFGAGLYRVVSGGPVASALVGACAQANVRLRPFAHGAVALAPPLDASQGDFKRLGDILAGALP
ncbi:MAG: aldehyde dehydrogenase family protein [Myxococcales bacterium]|nr:aldehyde dehydrogenase family protein [Myxococcales bacterium]